MITVYHNPKCSKSNGCVAFLEDSNVPFRVICYLDSPLAYAELKGILKKLRVKPIDLVRRDEVVWQQQFEGKKLTDRQLIQIMIRFPELMQRPIAVNGNKAVVARPFEKLREII